MTKISWTCKNCGMWHSVPNDAHLRIEMCTYEGFEFAELALKNLALFISQRLPADYLIRIESVPYDYKPSWLSERQRQAENLRRLMLLPIKEQTFPLLCEMCGFDSTDILKPGTPEATMVNIPMV